MVGGAFGVEAQHLRARADPGSGVRQIPEMLAHQRLHNLDGEPAGQLQPFDDHDPASCPAGRVTREKIQLSAQNSIPPTPAPTSTPPMTWPVV